MTPFAKEENKMRADLRDAILNGTMDVFNKKGLKFNLKANKKQYDKAVKLFKNSGVKKAKFRKI